LFFDCELIPFEGRQESKIDSKEMVAESFDKVVSFSDLEFSYDHIRRGNA